MYFVCDFMLNKKIKSNITLKNITKYHETHTADSGAEFSIVEAGCDVGWENRQMVRLHLPLRKSLQTSELCFSASLASMECINLHLVRLHLPTRKSRQTCHHSNSTTHYNTTDAQVVAWQTCNHEVACWNLPHGYCLPTPTQPAIPPGLVTEYQQKLWSKWTYHVMCSHI